MLLGRVCSCGRRALWWGLALGALLLAAALLLRWAAFPAILSARITQAVQLRDGSEALERFLKLPQPLLYKVYLFNVTNPDEARLGAKPELRQIGPYVYEEWRRKHDLVRLEDGSLSYLLETSFHFSPERSGGLSEDDVVTYLNLVMVGVVQQVAEDYSSLLTLVEPVLSELLVGGIELFPSATVGDLLWRGVPSVDCRGQLSGMAALACGALPSLLPVTVQHDGSGLYSFSFFGFKNGTGAARWRVDAGLSDVRALGSVLAYDNSSRLRTWSPLGSSCNELRGTDSTIFAPFITPNDTVHIFVNDICRSMHAEYERRQEVSGVPGLRFVATGKLLRSGGANACTCRRNERGESVCLPGGAIDVRSCLRAPIAVSFPHFYLGDPRYLQYADGLRPDKELHETFVVIEPESGAPLVGAKRLQLNMQTTSVPQVSVLQNVSSGLFPLLWIEEGAELEGPQLSQVRAIYVARASMGGAFWGVLAVGAVALVACGARLLRARLRERQQSLSLEKVGVRSGKLSDTTLGAAYPPPRAVVGATSAPAPSPADATRF